MKKQVLRDWIVCGAPQGAATTIQADPAPPARTLTFKTRQKLLHNLERQPGASAVAANSERRAGARSRTEQGAGDADDSNDFNVDARDLTLQLAQAGDRMQAMQLLTRLMAPTCHHTAVGLQATRIFTRMFGVPT